MSIAEIIRRIDGKFVYWPHQKKWCRANGGPVVDRKIVETISSLTLKDLLDYEEVQKSAFGI